MNARTAKLLRRYATVARLKYRSVKRAWNQCPRAKRAEVRKQCLTAV